MYAQRTSPRKARANLLPPRNHSGLDPAPVLGRKGREIRLSLRTSSKREARIRCRDECARLERESREHGARLLTERFGVRTKLEVGEEQKLLALWMRSVLQTDESERVNGFDDEDFEAYGGGLASTESELRAILARGRIEAIEPALDAFLHLAGYQLDLEPRARRRLAYRFLQTVVQTLELQGRRQNGEVLPTDQVVPAEAVSHPGNAKNDCTFGALLELWENARTNRPSKTLRAYRQAWTEFQAATPVSDPRGLTRAHVKAYVKAPEEGGAHFRTVEKKVGIVCSILQRAVIEERLPVNPALRIEVTKPAVIQKPRLPFELDELIAIFGHALFQMALKLPQRAGGAAAWWIPVLAYYTGARVEELAQLTVLDVCEVLGLGWYLDITDTGAGQHLKTRASRRRVPLRDEVIALGFLRCVEKMKSGGHVELFPALKANADGGRSAGFTRWFGIFLRELVRIGDKRKTLHSFRHGFRELCREAEIDGDVQRALVGHTRRTGKRDADELYGRETYPLRPLFTAIRKLEFPIGVKIPVLDAWGGRSAAIGTPSGC